MTLTNRERELLENINKILTERAPDAITYLQLAGKVVLPLKDPASRRRLAGLLGTLTRYYICKDLPLFTVLVVKKATGRPDDEFFRQARDLPRHRGQTDAHIFEFENKYIAGWVAERNKQGPTSSEASLEASLHRVLVATAREARVLTYAEAMRAVEMDPASDDDRREFESALKDVNSASYESDGILLSALVVGEGGIPEEGFYRQVFALGVDSRGGQRAIWERERAKVFEWAQGRDSGL